MTTQLYGYVMNIGEIFQTIPGNLSIIADYIGNNWRELIVDAFVGVGTMFENLGKNLGDLAAQVWNFLTTGNFDFKWTPLLDSFEAAAAKLPELIKPHLTDLNGVIAQSLEEAGRKDAEMTEAQRKAAIEAPKKSPEFHAAELGAKAADNFKSEMMSASDFSSKMRAAQLEGKGDDIPQQQLAEQKKAREIAEQQLEVSKKKTVAVLG